MDRHEPVPMTGKPSTAGPSSFRLSRQAQGQEGFLYVEVLVAVVILSLALVGVTPLFILAMKQNTASGDLTFAATAAQDKAEELKATDFATLAGGTDTVALNGMTFDRAWVVQNDTPHPGMKTITVTVTTNREHIYGAAGPAVVRFYRVP